jgi:predicted RNase H-like nuclease
VVVYRDLDTGQLDWQVCEKIQDFFNQDIPLAMGIDIPIGLPEAGARPCDLQTRRLLGPRRGSSVFPAPIRPVLGAVDYPQACRIRQEVEGKKISKQTWNITPKIREVDDLLRRNPGLQGRLREVHPEVCFYFMAGGQPLEEGKRTQAGYAARLRLLRDHFGDIVAAAVEGRDRQACAADDILDALAALWTAERILRCEAVTLPEDPPLDRSGLRMEIVV